jgi:hypothetical protein
MRKFASAILLAIALCTNAPAQTSDLPSDQPSVEQPAQPSSAPATEEPDSAEQERKWSATLTPVIWLATTTTDIQVGDRSRTLVLTAADALGDFQAGGSGRFEVHNGQWGGFADLFFINLENTSNVGPLGNVPLTVAVDNVLWQVAGTYRVVNEDDFDLDVFAGARGYSLDVDVTVEPFTGPAGILSFPGRFASRGLSFTDPILGAKAAWQLSDDWAFDLYGDIGGFGAGSDFTYRLGAGLGYSVNDAISLRAGYTMIDFDYSQGSGIDEVRYDTTMAGPTLGVGIKF